MTSLIIKLLAVFGFYLLGIAGAFAHLLSDFVTQTADDGESEEAFKAYYRGRKMRFILSCLLFSFLYIIWLGMKGWAVNYEKLATFSGISYGVFMSAVGYIADSLWNKGVKAAEKLAAKKAGLEDQPEPKPEG